MSDLHPDQLFVKRQKKHTVSMLIKKRKYSTTISLWNYNIKKIKIKRKIQMNESRMNESRMNVRCENLFRYGYRNLQHWLNSDNIHHVYVGDYSPHVLGTYQSKWSNPFWNDIDHGLDLYRQWLYSSGLIFQLDELRHCTLGCYCTNDNVCHVRVLLELLA